MKILFIADEAHKLLENRRLYTYFHSLSKRLQMKNPSYIGIILRKNTLKT